MQPRRRARLYLVVAVVLSVVLITMDFRGGGADGSGPLTRMRDGVASVLGPVQEGLATIVRPVSDGFGGIGDMFDLRRENTRLEERVDSLQAAERTVVDLERENAELRDLLDMRERLDAPTIAGRAIAAGASDFEWTITIDVGTDDGVERNMPVINQDGLVGRVLTTSRSTSRVLLAIDTNFAAASRIDRTGEIGTAEGRGSEPLSLVLDDPEADVEVGDRLLTSTYQGGRFPAGIPIGEVADAGAPTALLRREVVVRPFVDFTRLDHVLVIVHQAEAIETGDDAAETEQGPDLDLDLDEGDEPDDGEDGEADADDPGDDDDLPGRSPDLGPTGQALGATARSSGGRR